MYRLAGAILMLAAISTISQGHPAFSIREVNMTYETAYAAEECSSYYTVQEGWNDCLVPDNYNKPDSMSTNYILASLQYMCKEPQSVRNCMVTKYGDCSTWSTIDKLVKASTDICINKDIPADLKKFLTSKSTAGKKVTYDCIESALAQVATNICDVASMPQPTSNGMEGKPGNMKTILDWHVKCFKKLPDLNEAVDTCDGMTRRTVFGILISSIPSSFGLGVDFYSSFKDYMGTGKPLDLVEQIIKQRSMFYRNLEREAEQDWL